MKSIFQRKTQIPKIIHQIWIGSGRRPEYIMNELKHIICDSNIDIEYHFWDENKINEHFPDLLNSPAVQKCPQICGKVDIIRLHILRKFGGIYIDSDIQMIKPIPDECWNHKLFLSFEDEYGRGSLIANCIIGCVLNHPFISMMLNYIDDYTDSIYNTLHCVSYYGHGFFTNFFKLYSEFEPFIYPSYYWFKYTHDLKRENTFLTTQSIAHHLGSINYKILMECDNKIQYIEHAGYYCKIHGYKTMLICGNELGIIPKYIQSQWPEGLIYISSPKEEIEIQKAQQVIVKEENLDNYDIIINLSDTDYNTHECKVLITSKINKKCAEGKCIEIKSLVTQNLYYFHIT